MSGIEGSNGNKNGETFPRDVTIDILKRVPVKPLIRFNCVSKDWFKLFRTPHFITNHLHHHSLHNNFLLLQRVTLPPAPRSSSFCLIGQDLSVHNSQFLDFISEPVLQIVGSCNGLLCLRHTNQTLSICNPATRQIRQVPRTLTDTEKFYYAGFGFSSVVNDYKLVVVTIRDFDGSTVILDNVTVKRVEVYSLATGSWREIDARSLQNLCPMSKSIAVGGALFWKATTNHDADELVLSFDIRREVFTVLKGPPAPSSATAQFCSTMLSVYNNKLAMLHHLVKGKFEASSIDLWVLDYPGRCASDGGERWIKQYSVGPFPRMIYPQSIWRDEILCIEELRRRVDESGLVETTLSLYSPRGKESRNLPAHRTANCYLSFIYAESLVPVANIQLDQ